MSAQPAAVRRLVDGTHGSLQVRANVERPEVFQAVDRFQVRRIITRNSAAASVTDFRLHEPIADGGGDGRLAASADLAFLSSRTWPEVKPTNGNVAVVDLFAGCGAMSLGVWEACRALNKGMQVLLAVDFNVAAVRTYKANFPGARAVVADVESLLDGDVGAPCTAIERRLRRLSEVDLVIGGPPCQGHSDLNNHTRRRDPKNRLYDRMVRFAEIVRPRHIVIENVPAVCHDSGRIVERCIECLQKTGYEMDAGVIEMARFGVAQRRRRHFVVASLERPVRLSSLSSYEVAVRPASWAISDLVDGSISEEIDRPSTPSALAVRRMKYLFEKNVYDLPDRLRPDCHRYKAHSYTSVYGRMRWDEPAQTITSGFTCMGQGRFVHPSRMRTLTPHEAARLQFIPDFFQFPDDLKRTAIAQLIANAVPPKLAYVIGLELLR